MARALGKCTVDPSIKSFSYPRSLPGQFRPQSPGHSTTLPTNNQSTPSTLLSPPLEFRTPTPLFSEPHPVYVPINQWQ